MPTVVGVGSILDAERRVPEARLSISRVLRLWLCQAERTKTEPPYINIQ